jgi:hypothetical protein
VVPRPSPRCASQVLDRDSQADARGAAQIFGRGAQSVASGVARCASQVLDRGAKAVARGAARRASQVLDRGAQAVASGAARCASQVLGRGAQAVARGAAHCASQIIDRLARPLPAVTVAVRCRYFSVRPGRCPRRRDAVAAGEEQLDRCTAKQSKHYWLYVHSGNIALAAMYPRRVRVTGVLEKK